MGNEPEPTFRALYEAEAEQVFRTVFLLCRDEDLARDATQEAFARALERWDRLQGEPWLGAWVTTVALNVAKRSLRRVRPTEAHSPHEGGPMTLNSGMWSANSLRNNEPYSSFAIASAWIPC